MTDNIKTLKVHYRQALYQPADDSDQNITLEQAMREVLQGPAGDDFSSRIFPLNEERSDKAMINNHFVDPPGVFVEVFHLDGRREMPFLKRGRASERVAKVHSRLVPHDEDAMGSPSYLMIVGNHIAAIESVVLRFGALQNYCNALLSKTEVPSLGTWRLVPKIQIDSGSPLANRGVTKLEIMPTARLVGDGPSHVIPSTGKKPSKISTQAEARMAKGSKVFDILKLLGASEADLGSIRNSMSTDLGLEARVQIIVKKNNRKTDATLDTDDISQAVASLEQDNAVSIVSPDGKSRNALSTLSDVAEVAEVGGLLSVQHVASSLTGVLFKWNGKGIIDLQGASK